MEEQLTILLNIISKTMLNSTLIVAQIAVFVTNKNEVFEIVGSV